MSDTETVGFTVTPDPEGTPPDGFVEVRLDGFFVSLLSPEEVQEFLKDRERIRLSFPAESLGDKFVRWSGPLECRLRGRYWIVWVLSFAVYFAAIAIGCWIQGESFISVVTYFWR